MRRCCLLALWLVCVPCAGWPQGNPLGPEFRINTFTADDQWQPSVASDVSGNFVVVWTSEHQDGATGYGVFGQRFANTGAPLGPEFRINTATVAHQSMPALATDNSGNFVVVWVSHSKVGAWSGIFGQRYASTGAPLGPEFRVNTFTPGLPVDPAVGADAAGNFVVAWTSDFQDGSLYSVFGQRYAHTGAPLGPEFRVNTYTTGPQFFPAVVSDASGNSVVVWQSAGQDGSDFGIFGQRYGSSGVPLGAEFRVNTFTTGDQAQPAVAADSSGNFVVVWASYGQDGSYDGVFGQRYATTGAPLGPEFRANTFTPDSQPLPAVAVDTFGNFVIAWTSSAQDGSSGGIFGQRYASSGVPLGPEFRINTFTTDLQMAPELAADSSGNFVVVWESNLQDGSSDGVFGQRYGPIVPVELMHFGIE